VAKNGLKKVKEKTEVDDGVEGVATGQVSAMSVWLVQVTYGKGVWTEQSMGLTANANSQGPKVGLIWRGSVVKAWMVWVALTDRRRGKPGRG
jgi:hypothetical protein